MSRTKNDLLISTFLVLLLIWVVREARDWPFLTRFFPWAIGFPVLALALIQFGIACWNAMRQGLNVEPVNIHHEPIEKAAAEAILDPKLLRQRTLSISAWTLAFALGFWLFGFKVGGLLMTPSFLRFQAHESWKMSILYGLGIYLFFFAGLETALRFPLPSGLIATSLGLQSFDSYLVNPLLNILLRR